MTTISDERAQLIWELRHGSGLSCRHLADLFKVSPQTVLNVANGPEPIPGGLQPVGDPHRGGRHP